MRTLDMFLLAVISGSSALALELKIYSLSVFLFCWFLIFLTAIVIHYVSSPLPRIIIGAVVEQKGENDSSC